MRIRRIAILIDGGYFLKRLPKLRAAQYRSTPAQIADSARYLCKQHVLRLTGLEPDGDKDGHWLDHVYRLFYYDAEPYTGKAHHPVDNRPIDFDKTDTARFRRELFVELRRKRKFALRLGHVKDDGGWQIHPRYSKTLLKAQRWAAYLQSAVTDPENTPELTENQQRELANAFRQWKELPADCVRLAMRQKGVDMRIGLDIASITLKKQADTIILVTGDSDFVPAAKLARREGVEFLLDPMWQSIRDDLHEHVDGIVSVFDKPNGNHHGN